MSTTTRFFELAARLSEYEQAQEICMHLGNIMRETTPRLIDDGIRALISSSDHLRKGGHVKTAFIIALEDMHERDAVVEVFSQLYRDYRAHVYRSRG